MAAKPPPLQPTSRDNGNGVHRHRLRHVTIRNQFLDTSVVRCPINVNEPLQRQVIRSLNLHPSSASSLHIKHGGHLLDDEHTTLADLGRADGAGDVSLFVEQNPHDLGKHMHVLRFHTPTKSDVTKFRSWVNAKHENLGHIDVWHHAAPGKFGDVCVPKHVRGNDSGLKLESFIPCLQEAHMLADRPWTDPFHTGSSLPDKDIFHTGYHSHEDMLKFVSQKAHQLRQLPNMHVEHHNLGDSFEGRPVHALRISAIPNGAHGLPVGSPQRPEILFTAGMHAREWIAPAVMMKFLDNIHDDLHANKCTPMRDMLEYADMTVIPMVNPDGYEYSRVTDRSWRKTRTRHPGIMLKGVDPNRNFSARWGTLSSGNCGDEDFHGPSPESEKVVQHLANYIRSRPNLAGYMDCHSYGKLILFPHGYTTERDHDFADQMRVYTRQSEAMQRVMKTMGSTNTEAYTVGPVAETLYACSGGVIDFAKDLGVKYSVCVELPGFGTGLQGFYARPHEILPVARHSWAGAMSFAGDVVSEHMLKLQQANLNYAQRNAATPAQIAVRPQSNPMTDMWLSVQQPVMNMVPQVAFSSTAGGVTASVAALPSQQILPGAPYAFVQAQTGTQFPANCAMQQQMVGNNMVVPGLPQQGFYVMQTPMVAPVQFQAGAPTEAGNAPTNTQRLLGGSSTSRGNSVVSSHVPVATEHALATGSFSHTTMKNGVTNVPAMAARRSDPFLETFDYFPRRRVGITNLGNTCFMNSMMQCLASTSPLVKHCLSMPADSSTSGGGFGTFQPEPDKTRRLVQEFSRAMCMLHQLNDGDTTDISDFKDSLSAATNRFRGFRQEDSSEFLTVLRNALHEGMCIRRRTRTLAQPYLAGDTEFSAMAGDSGAGASTKIGAHSNLETQSILSDVFRGRCKSVVTCGRCQHRSETEHPMWELAVDIPRNQFGVTSLDQCLQSYFTADSLTGSNQYQCDRCKSKQDATKQYSVSQFPRVLAVVLKRFEGVSGGGDGFRPCKGVVSNSS